MARKRHAPRQYCAGDHGAACVRNGTPHAICEIMGPVRPMTREFAAMIVANGAGGSVEFREALIDRMVRTGDCLWHAAARVLNKPCSCTGCVDPNHPAHEWVVAS